MTATAVETAQTVQTTEAVEDTRPAGVIPEPGTRRFQVSFSTSPLAYFSWEIYAESVEEAKERMYLIMELDGQLRAAAETNVTVRPLPPR